jgi:hypothetical protein
MSNAFPRLVANEARARSTNTIHNVWLVNGVLPGALTVAFYNSLTLLSAELVGRSYGGGILKLEPTEAERLLIPTFPASAANRLPHIDGAIRRGDVNAALDIVDAIVLRPLGLSDREIEGLRNARENLFARRRARTRENGAPTTHSPRNRRTRAASDRGPAR